MFFSSHTKQVNSGHFKLYVIIHIHIIFKVFRKKFYVVRKRLHCPWLFKSYHGYMLGLNIYHGDILTYGSFSFFPLSITKLHSQPELLVF